MNAPEVNLGLLGVHPVNHCAFNGTMSGTSMNEQISMTVAVPAIGPSLGNETLALSGKPLGNTVSGTYSVTSGCVKGDSGSFQIQPAPSFTSSQWSGTWAGPMGGEGTASANLTEDPSGKMTGTVALDNACDNFGSGARKVTGAVNGRTIGLSADLGGTQYGLGGFISSDGKTLQIEHTCNDLFNEPLDASLTHP